MIFFLNFFSFSVQNIGVFYWNYLNLYLMKGIVIKNTGSNYLVRTEDGRDLSCKIKGNFRLKGIRTTNPVAVGDIVSLTETAGGSDTPYIISVEPRRKLYNTSLQAICQSKLIFLRQILTRCVL